MNGRIPTMIKITSITDMNPAYIRRDMGDLRQLAQSLKDVGPKIPILLTGSFLILDGARRIEAAKLLGWTEYPAIVTDDWWEIRDHFIFTRKQEKVLNLPIKPMRWMEIADLIDLTLRPAYRPVRFNLNAQNKKMRYRSTDEHPTRPAMRNRFVADDVAPMLGLDVSFLVAIRAIAAKVTKARNAGDRELTDRLLNAVKAEEDGKGRIWSAAHQVEDLFHGANTQEVVADVRAAKEQAQELESAIALIERVGQQLQKMPTINPSMSLETARSLYKGLRRARRSLSARSLLRYLDAEDDGDTTPGENE